jgi:hypothetical protein
VREHRPSYGAGKTSLLSRSTLGWINAPVHGIERGFYGIEIKRRNLHSLNHGWGRSVLAQQLGGDLQSFDFSFSLSNLPLFHPEHVKRVFHLESRDYEGFGGCL